MTYDELNPQYEMLRKIAADLFGDDADNKLLTAIIGVLSKHSTEQFELPEQLSLPVFRIMTMAAGALTMVKALESVVMELGVPKDLIMKHQIMQALMVSMLQDIPYEDLAQGIMDVSNAGVFKK